MRVLTLLLLLGTGLQACRQSDSMAPEAASLTGVWVETSARKDTLVFNPLFNGTILANTLQVNREKVVNSEGSLVPKLGSGLYQYELQGNKISVYNLASSSLQRTAYTIEQTGGKLLLDNFFELGTNQPATATRTLVRL